MFYGYARVSTLKQNDTSLDVQIRFLEKLAKSMGEEFEEHREKKSGKNTEGRPVLTSIINKMKNGDILGVYDDSRLGRNATEIQVLVADLFQRGARVFIGSTELDKNDPNNKLIFGIQTVISQYFRELQNAKSIESLHLKRSNGDHVFAGDTFGYKLEGDRKHRRVSVDPKSAEVIKYCFQEYAKGKSVKSICEALVGVPLDQAFDINIINVSDMLKRPLYMGYYLAEARATKTITRFSEAEVRSMLVKSNFYPPIVTEDEWWAVFRSWRTIKRRNARSYDTRWTKHEFSGLYHCFECGKGMTFHNKYKTKEQVNPIEEYIFNGHTITCQTHYYTAYSTKFIELATRGCFFLSLLQGENLAPYFEEKKKAFLSSSSDIENQIKEIDRLLVENKKGMARILQLVEDGIMTGEDIKEKVDKLKADKENYLSRRRSLENALLQNSANYDDYIQVFSESLIEKYLSSNSVSKRSILLDSVVEGTNDHKQLVLRLKNEVRFVITRPKRTNFTIKNTSFEMYFGDETEPRLVGTIDSMNYKFILEPVATDDEFYAVAYKTFYEPIIEKVNDYLLQCKEGDNSRIDE